MQKVAGKIQFFKADKSISDPITKPKINTTGITIGKYPAEGWLRAED